MSEMSPVVPNSLVSYISKKTLEYTGVHLSQTQIPPLAAYLEKRAAENGLSVLEYCEKITPGMPDFCAIINLVTVKETYFFREEKQFDFLKQEVFPKYMGKNLSIWTCCCATGEEPISLLALALSMNVNLTIYASDIDDVALNTFRQGRYLLYSLRPDGEKFHKCLEPYSMRTETELVFKQNFLDRIHIFNFNMLGDMQKLPFHNVDIIFMRNVFIYFDKETRTVVTRKVSERLCDGGKLFLSMNEVGSIEDDDIPRNLYKTNSGVVYYFQKGTRTEKTRPCASKPVASGRSGTSSNTSYKSAKSAKSVVKANIGDKLNESAEPIDIKRIYEDICNEIGRGDFARAQAISQTITGAENKKYSFFMQGYIAYHSDNRAAAETLFASAETISPDFWPASFYLGLVLRDVGKTERAKACFTKCKNLISGFGQNVPYDFTLDSFSPTYIYSLCDTLSREKDTK